MWEMEVAGEEGERERIKEQCRLICRPKFETKEQITIETGVLIIH